MTPTPTLEVTLINGVPFVKCGQCNGSGDDGNPPFCDECFGAGIAPLDGSAIRAAKLGQDLDVHVQSYRNSFSNARHGERVACTNNMANQYPGPCIKCGGHVAANAGWRTRDGQKWCTQHRIGECIVKTEATPAQAVRSNRYAAPCVNCGEQVAAEAGKLSGKPGAWITEHIVCPEIVTEIIVQSPVVDPTAELVARLEVVLDYVTPGKREFAGSLVEQFNRKGYLSPRQTPYVEQFVASAEEAAAEDTLRPITENILARAPGRASLRFAIPSGGENSLDFLCVYRGRMERHVGSPGDVRKIRLGTAQAVTLATRIMDLDDAAFVAAQALYGTGIHHCGRCGASLTDDTSKAQGFGPECITKVGF